MTGTRAKILIVDDEPAIADTLALIFSKAGYIATAVYSGKKALALVASERPALVITDVVMPGMDGIELAKTIRSSHPGCHILLISGNAGNYPLLEVAREAGHSFEILPKPIHPRILIAKVASLLSETPSST
jgi:CheY-like chemotaxis protein